MKQPLVSILVVNYNGLRFLKDIFDSIEGQSYPEEKLETFLVDNASEDDSVEFVEENFPWVKIMQTESNLGFAGACDYAYKKLNSDFVLPLNNDIILHKDYVKNLVETSLDKDVAIVDAEEYPPGTDLEKVDPNPLTTINLTSNYVEVDEEFGEEVQFSGSGGASLVRKDKLKTLFDPDYFIYQEDIYMGWNARLRGEKAVRDPDAKFIHIGFGTVGTRPIFKHYLERNRVMNCLLFYERRNIFKIGPLLLYEACVKLLKSLIRDRQAFKAIWRAYAWILNNLDVVRNKRRSIQEARGVGDDEIVKCMSYRLFGLNRKGIWGKLLLVQDAFVRGYLGLVGIKTGDM